MSIIIKNGLLLTNEGELVEKDVYINDGKIVEIGENLQIEGSELIHGKGLLVSPGFIDLHIHLREPGGEHKETIATGTLAAAKGGFTTVAAMPNTNPVPDRKESLQLLLDKINDNAKVRVLPYAAITIGQKGEELTDIPLLSESGAFAFTDDGVGIQEAGKMYEAMKRAAKQNKAVVAHCEDESLLQGGAVHEGVFSKKYGLKGIPSVSESVHIARDVLLAEATGCHYHVCHISTKESVRVVRDAKKAGIKVTCEVTPHHLLLCDEDIPGLDTNYKMNPPLRGKEDQEALIEGLLDGTIDFIATDHAPHTEEEKGRGMEKAPFGIVGLETAFPLIYTHFVKTGILTLKQCIDLFTLKPAKAFSLPYGQLQAGEMADITLIDLNHKEKIDVMSFASKGKNSPFHGWECFGWPVLTIAAGEMVWRKEK